MKGRRPDVNKNNTLCVLLLELRRHLNSCTTCRAAMDANAIDSFCAYTIRRIIDVARRWDKNIAGRLAARKEAERLQFLCPDPNAHGAAYAMTAEAVHVTTYQDALF